SDINLLIKSHDKLNWSSSAPHYGPNSPIALNVTGTLWNGDPFYSQYDGTIWHSNSPTNWWGSNPYNGANLTYPWQYSIVFSAHASNGAPNFFPGMTVQWWIYLTYNVSINSSSQYVHHSSPVFQFTYAGAWPFSPYPGSAQYAGSSSVFQDLNVTVTPRAPNFNDSVRVVVNTTQSDVLTNATIGQNSYLDLTETSPDGFVIAKATLDFPVDVEGGFGAVTTSVTISSAFSQIAGATISYSLAIRDVSNDLLTTVPISYVVGGNGTFLSGVFTDDLDIESTPGSVVAEPVDVAQINPGETLNLTLLSRNPGTAISAVEVVCNISYPLLHETAVLKSPFTRVSSTEFVGSVPALPIGSFVNFTVDAWDFAQRLEISPGFGYYVPDLATTVPVIPDNASFVYVFVYDNGSQTWVSGAEVTIQGFNNVYNSIGNTTFGVAYPNQTFQPYAPLLLPANASYRITVHDPWFVPSAPGLTGGDVNATVLLLHTMTARQTLFQGDDYAVVQEGNAVVFWLNATAPNPSLSPTTNSGGSVPLGAVVGIVGSVVVGVPVVLWWMQIRRRRKEEERRVTL
ncbi:MAG TPA: hypothetical protein VMH78_03510, partial [Thermoplasmata archaeon]|nr:hypothetical protein [Thermoplasmata archaeon]